MHPNDNIARRTLGKVGPWLVVGLVACNVKLGTFGGKTPATPTGGSTSATSDSSDVPGVSPTGAPVGLAAAGVAADEIDTWWRPVPGATGYVVLRDGVEVARPVDEHFEDTGLAPASTHRYTVAAAVGRRASPPCAPASATTNRADEDGDVQPGDLATETTLNSAGFSWNVSGDADHDATVRVLFREAGSWRWRAALPLLRVDYDGQDQLAGSLLFLDPGARYDVDLYLTDPDGGVQTKRLSVTTRPTPTLPTNGRTFEVVPGSGGGDGSQENPFRGVDAAAAVARPGDVMRLHAGHYGGRVTFGVAGESGQYVVWKAAGDGEPVFDGVLVSASHQWLEGLHIAAGAATDFPIGLETANAPDDVVVERCTVTGNHYGIYLDGGGSRWYIADNTIVGDNDVASGSLSGEAVEFEHTGGHVLAHNSISHVADGNSYCDRACDIFGNDIFDVSDDGLEPDGGFGNIRIWGNRLTNTGHNGISFQPQGGAPWYVVRNQLIGQSEGPLKLRGADRFVFAHNTLVNWTHLTTTDGDQMLSAFSRNNLFVSVKGGTVLDLRDGTPGWETDLDYDGFDADGSSDAFEFQGTFFPTLAAFSRASGLEPHGVEVTHACFPTLDVPAPPPASLPFQIVELAPGCPAIDAGVPLPGLDDDYVGRAPDLGAVESGAPLPQFGPRPVGSAK